MDGFDGVPSHNLRPALRVANVHPEKRLDNEVKNAAGKLAAAALLDVQDCARQPSRADDAIRFADVLHEIVKRVWGRRSVRIHIANHIRERRELETFYQRATFANRLFELDHADKGKVSGYFLDDAVRIVAAAVEDNDELKSTGVIRFEVRAIVAEDWIDPVFLVVRGDKEE
jgi:hypothetical protein